MLPQQRDYIKCYVDSFEYALNGPDFADTSIGYAKYIDVNSFIDLFLINELSRNTDGYRLSTYMYKDRNDNSGKLTMGPFWDYNLGFGNNKNCSGYLTSGWEADGDCPYVEDNIFWFQRLLEDSNYQNKLKFRWEYLRERSFHQDSIFSFIDSVSLYLNDAQQRNFLRWDILGGYVFPNYYVGDTYQEELTFFKNWISERLTWMDNNILPLEEEPHLILNEFRVFPNPTDRMLNLKLIYSDLIVDFKVTLTNILGEHFILDSQFSFSGIYTKEIDLNGFAKGIYILSLESNDRIFNKKLILQ